VRDAVFARDFGNRLAWAATAVVAALLLVACGDKTGSPAAGTFTALTPGVLTVVTTDIPSPGFWEGTLSRPTGGLEFDLATLLAKRLGLRRVRVEKESFHRIVEGNLASADLALDLITPTSERERRLAFSSPYLDAAPTAVVRSATSIPDLESARALRWGAVRGTTFVDIVASHIAPQAPLGFYDNTSTVVEALERGRIDAVLLDLPLAVVTADHSGGRLRAAAQLPEPESIAAALPKGSPNVEAVDSALRAFVADGTIHRLLQKWVGPTAANAEKSLPLLQTMR
jgi:polar amino acid transport system substrate-binding protein